MIRDVIGALLTTKASKGLDTPAIALRALDQAETDLAETQQQLNVLTLGWDMMNLHVEQS